MKKLTVFFVLSLIFVAFGVEVAEPLEANEQIKSFISSNSFYAIDDVLSLLQALLDESNNDLNELETSWATNYVEKTETIQNITKIISDLQETCTNYHNVVLDFNKTISSIVEKIQEYQDIIDQNQNRSQVLKDARCQANQNYILGLTKNKNALALIAILRQAIEDFNEDSFIQYGIKKFVSLAQILSQMARKNRKFLTLLQENVPDLPDVSERTSDEIGTGHVDNDQGEITVESLDSQTLESFQGIKTKLLNLLDELETDINNEIATNQVNEMASNENLADFEVSITNENNYYTALIRNLTVELNETIEEFSSAFDDDETCTNQLQSWQETLQSAQIDLQNSTDYYNSKKQEYTDLINLFTEIYKLYKNEVQSVSEEYKQRADDYIDDQTFNTSENFTSRSADQYTNMSGEVHNQTYDEASQNVDNAIVQNSLGDSTTTTSTAGEGEQTTVTGGDQTTTTITNEETTTGTGDQTTTNSGDQTTTTGEQTNSSTGGENSSNTSTTGETTANLVGIQSKNAKNAKVMENSLQKMHNYAEERAQKLRERIKNMKKSK